MALKVTPLIKHKPTVVEVRENLEQRTVWTVQWPNTCFSLYSTRLFAFRSAAGVIVRRMRNDIHWAEKRSVDTCILCECNCHHRHNPSCVPGECRKASEECIEGDCPPMFDFAQVLADMKTAFQRELYEDMVDAWNNWWEGYLNVFALAEGEEDPSIHVSWDYIVE